MRVRVCGVVELIGPDGVRQILCVVPGLVIVVQGVLICNGGNGVDLGAQHAQEIDLLLTLHPGLDSRKEGCEAVVPGCRA